MGKKDTFDPQTITLLVFLYIIFTLIRLYYVKDYSRLESGGAYFLLWLFVQFWGFIFILYLGTKFYDGIKALFKANNKFIYYYNKLKYKGYDGFKKFGYAFGLFLIWATIIILSAIYIIIFFGGILLLLNYTNRNKSNFKSGSSSTSLFDC